MDAEVAEERGQFRNEKTPHGRVHEIPNFFIISVGIFFCAKLGFENVIILGWEAQSITFPLIFIIF